MYYSNNVWYNHTGSTPLIVDATSKAIDHLMTYPNILDGCRWWMAFLFWTRTSMQ